MDPARHCTPRHMSRGSFWSHTRAKIAAGELRKVYFRSAATAAWSTVLRRVMVPTQKKKVGMSPSLRIWCVGSLIFFERTSALLANVPEVLCCDVMCTSRVNLSVPPSAISNNAQDTCFYCVFNSIIRSRVAVPPPQALPPCKQSLAPSVAGDVPTTSCPNRSLFPFPARQAIV